MDQQTPEAEKAFLARQLVQVTLPVTGHTLPRFARRLAASKLALG